MLSKTGTHALRAVIALAELPHGEFAGAAAIAAEIKAPRNYLGKLLQQLAHAGIVESQKGMGGGFRLARLPETISLFDVVDPIDHIDRWTGCLLGQDRCADGNACALHHRWKTVRDAYIQMLKETRISDLIHQDLPLVLSG
ncbi:MAG: Rrf2 family transcriptional regulator [bacterium]|jgi:Rrf2 family protein|nr:Rrf2 family transcriptional regulator [bacterium]